MPRLFLPRGNAVSRLVWMRRLFAMFALAGAAAGGWPALAPRAAAAAEWHPTFALTGGVRFFRGDVDLDTDVAYGARAALVEERHVGVVVDYCETRTIRDATQHAADVRSLRAFGRFQVLRGPVRPYALAGLGGVLIQFKDTPSAALGTFTAGAGVETRIGPRWRPFIEWTMEIYDYEPVFYTSTGSVYTQGQRGRSWIDTLAAGLAVAF